jgi:nitrogen fixation protein FixH
MQPARYRLTQAYGKHVTLIGVYAHFKDAQRAKEQHCSEFTNQGYGLYTITETTTPEPQER